MLDIQSARMLSETLWGRAETRASRTNHAGAWWFDCSDHGGLILDMSRITHDQAAEVSSFGRVLTGYVLSNDGVPQRAGRGEVLLSRRGWQREDVEFMAFEKDRDWCVPLMVLGIGRLSDLTNMEALTRAQQIFDRYFDPLDPEVMARRDVEDAMEAGESDLIVAAIRASNDQCKVWTADGRQWLVEGYESAKGHGGAHYLSLCQDTVQLDDTGRPLAEARMASNDAEAAP